MNAVQGGPLHGCIYDDLVWGNDYYRALLRCSGHRGEAAGLEVMMGRREAQRRRLQPSFGAVRQVRGLPRPIALRRHVCSADPTGLYPIGTSIRGLLAKGFMAMRDHVSPFSARNTLRVLS